jgi:hypothetical protein
MSNNSHEHGGWTIGDELTPAEQAAWNRLDAAEAELTAACWAVIEATNRESRERAPRPLLHSMSSDATGEARPDRRSRRAR